MRTWAFRMLLLLVFTIPCETIVEHPMLGSAARLIGFATAASWIAAVLVTGRVRRTDTFHLALFAYVAWNAATILWSADAGRTVTHVVTWVQLLLMSIILWNLCTTRESVMDALQAYILGAYVVVGNTVLNYLRGAAFYYGRFSAAGTNPDDAGLVLALGIPIAAYLTAFRRHGRADTLLRILNSLYVVGAFVGIALSGTRTAVIVAVPGMVFAAALVGRAKPTRQLAVALVIAIAVGIVTPLIPEASFQRLGTTGSELASGDLNGRIAVWREGLNAVEQHPVFGVGSNMFRSVNVKGKVAHNSFLSVLVELGAIGFALFVALLGVAAMRIFAHAGWDRCFWFSVLAGWAIGASALTWEHRKATWLLLNLIVASAATHAGRVAARSTAPFTARVAPSSSSPIVQADVVRAR